MEAISKNTGNGKEYELLKHEDFIPRITKIAYAIQLKD